MVPRKERDVLYIRPKGRLFRRKILQFIHCLPNAFLAVSWHNPITCEINIWIESPRGAPGRRWEECRVCGNNDPGGAVQWKLCSNTGPLVLKQEARQETMFRSHVQPERAFVLAVKGTSRAGRSRNLLLSASVMCDEKVPRSANLECTKTPPPVLMSTR